MGLLVASGELEPDAVEGMAFVGELGLDGSLRGVPGTVVLAEALGSQVLVVPDVCAGEAGLSGDRSIRSAPTLANLVERLAGREPWERPEPHPVAPPSEGRAVRSESRAGHPDLSDVRGQRWARRALEVAAAGGHHLLLVGPPGSGKTMLANRLPDLLPPLERSTALEVSRVHSVAGLPLPPGGPRARPGARRSAPRTMAPHRCR